MRKISELTCFTSQYSSQEAMSQILASLQETKANIAKKCNQLEELGQQLLVSEHEKEEVAIALERVQMNLEEVEAQSQMAANRYEDKVWKFFFFFFSVFKQKKRSIKEFSEGMRVMGEDDEYSHEHGKGR